MIHSRLFLGYPPAREEAFIKDSATAREPAEQDCVTIKFNDNLQMSVIAESVIDDTVEPSITLDGVKYVYRTVNEETYEQGWVQE